MIFQKPNFILPPQTNQAQQVKTEESPNQHLNKLPTSRQQSLPNRKVSVKYQRFGFHTSSIKFMALSVNNILAISSGNDGSKVKFMSVKENGLQLQMTELKIFRSITMRHNILQWSPNGEYLAVGGSRLRIWKWEGGQIDLFKEYPEDFYDIYGFAWAPDSQRFAVSSINKQMALVVRDINQQRKIQEIKDISIIVALRWDPFNKHLACLACNNTMHIYSCVNWAILHSINLSSKTIEKREAKGLIFKIDWSPDFRYILSPSTQNKPIPYIAALDRNKSFDFKGIMIGPFSTINCVRCNPCLFQLPSQQIVSVVAAGDSEGTIAIWLIGQKYKPAKPLMTFKTEKYEQMVIQNLMWNTEGNVLYATVFSDYIITIVFQTQVFGKKLNEQETQKILQRLYGSTKLTDSKFKVYRFGDAKPLPTIQKQPSNTSKIIAKKDQYVFTSQQIITIAGNKKKIQPSVLVKASQKEALESKMNILLKPGPNILPKNLIINKTPQNSKSPQVYLPTNYQPQPTHKLIIHNMLSLSVLSKKQSSYRISASKHLEVESKPNEDLVLVYHKNSQQHRELLATISIPGRINYLSYSDSIILIYSNQGYIYLFSETGSAVELPMLVGQLHLIKLRGMDLLTISTNCNLRFFNLQKKKLYVSTNILDLIGNNMKVEANKIITKAIEYVEIGENNQISIQLVNKKKFLLNQTSLAWHMVPNQIYSLTLQQQEAKFKQMYPTIEENLLKMSKSFFDAMIKPPVVSSVQELQYNLIFFKQHNPNPQKFSLTLVNYIKELAKLNMDGRLRQVIVKHILEKTQGVYSSHNQDLINSIKGIDNPIISEFVQLGLLK